ncbi:DUF5318 family protein [Corynebacterium uterequi]|uniref:DUF5318 family protein n=1 Tax=Corynebacterium uterequi TaxID=1072256 RepID=A0A0G3HFP7_9CORY|nr:DUF5318 family protein [Corynebacterium uterequi]AKK12136.1 hypothetical protein CUTER_10875 [Corynebacterium uterequi]
MLHYRNHVSHQLARAVRLRHLAAGVIHRRDVCDADAVLVSAATFHGDSAGRPCPVCEGDGLRVVRWIYGDTLGRRNGTARREEEIELILTELAGVAIPRGKDGVVAVHEVEVCPDCRWNHLLVTSEAYVNDR